MQTGTLWTNISRIARGQLAAQSTGGKANIHLSEDEASEKIPRRIMIEHISVQASAPATYTVRIFTRQAKVNTPGQSNYSLLWEQAVAASAALQIYDVSMPYVDEDATANDIKSENTPNEISATIWAEIETTTGTDVNYDLCIGFKQ
jgi:hypothetical protein